MLTMPHGKTLSDMSAGRGIASTNRRSSRAGGWLELTEFGVEFGRPGSLAPAPWLGLLPARLPVSGQRSPAGHMGVGPGRWGRVELDKLDTQINIMNLTGEQIVGINQKMDTITSLIAQPAAGPTPNREHYACGPIIDKLVVLPDILSNILTLLQPARN
ncbi:hypothetical protein NDU88_003077 [Pleurodeles waltl]|uniref:Uncharacterized protein n=1 Tax=Pleurodeles waltl TaxID=8319 RepID=A0AAV7T474_PLEWA|nr:hypothetical protein NDU88_003077 [Pleurodeles waltl]